MTVVEFWVEQYQTVVAENKALGDKLRETLEENKELQQQLDRLKNSLTYDYLKSMDMENGRLKEENNDLQQKINGLTSSNEAIRSINSSLSRSLASSMHQAQELKMQLEGTKERLDKSIADRSELQADRDIWFNKNCEKQAEIEELKKQLEYFTHSRDEWRSRAKHAEKQLEEIRQEFKQSYADGYSDGNEEGQNELWEMLQMVKDIQPNEFDVECECLGDVIDMDLEDFKEAYGKWEAEQKKAAEEAKKQHVDYMRDYLKRYCIGKICFSCPLYNASESVGSCIFSKLTDEEIEKKYRKVVDSEWEKAPRYFRSTIETVFTAEAKINKDLLKDICGIKDDKK